MAVLRFAVVLGTLEEDRTCRHPSWPPRRFALSRRRPVGSGVPMQRGRRRKGAAGGERARWGRGGQPPLASPTAANCRVSTFHCYQPREMLADTGTPTRRGRGILPTQPRGRGGGAPSSQACRSRTRCSLGDPGGKYLIRFSSRSRQEGGGNKTYLSEPDESNLLFLWTAFLSSRNRSQIKRCQKTIHGAHNY